MQEVADSPYSIVVTPGAAHGPSSSAYGAGITAAVATLESSFYVQVGYVSLWLLHRGIVPRPLRSSSKAKNPRLVPCGCWLKNVLMRMSTPMMEALLRPGTVFS